MNFPKAALLLLTSLAAAFATNADALQPGRLDTSFGAGGKQIVELNLDTNAPWNVTASVTGADGSIYVVGTASDNDATFTMALAKLTPAGQPDTGFGDGGVKLFLPAGLSGVTARDIALDPQGRLVVAGSTGGSSRMIACRFTQGGEVDTTFGTPVTPGCFVHSFTNVQGEAVLVQNGTGRIVMAGTSVSNGQSIGIVLGLLPDGSAVDVDFGLFQGLQAIQNDVFSDSSAFLALAQNASGDLATAGWGYASDHDFLIFRMTTDGKPETAFAGQAIRVPVFNLTDSGMDEATSVALLDDGSVVAAGFAQSSVVSNRPAVFRANADGTNVTLFDYEGAEHAIDSSDGRISYSICGAVCDARVHDVAVSADGKILLTGSIGEGVDGDGPAQLAAKSDFFAMRLLPAGQPDPTFRSSQSPFDGLSVIPISVLASDAQDAAFSLDLTDDKILLSGFSRIDDVFDDSVPDYNFTLVRLGNASPLFADGFED